MPPEWNACARQSRVCPCYTTWCAPIIRCRSASLAVVQPNHRLPEHSTMRRAQQCRYFARSLPPRKRHSRLTIVRRGCKRSRLAGIHGEAMYTAPTLRSACSSSRLRLPMQTPFFWTGDARFLSTERKWGSRSCSAYGAASPRHKCRDPLRTCAEKGALYGIYNESHCQNPL